MENELHAYSQDSWHDDLVVAGDEEGLKALRNAIDEALQEGHGQSGVFVNDGEGYRALVLRKDNLDDLPVPYDAEYAEEFADERWANLRKQLQPFYDDQ